MNHIKALVSKEMKSYWGSPMAYIFIVIFLVVCGIFFSTNLFLARQASVRGIVEGVIPLALLFFAPAITMRLLAEEKRSGTLEVLTTMPVKDTEIVLGKYIAAFYLVGIAVLLTFPYVLTVALLGKPDWGVIVGGYLGLGFLSLTYLAVGMFATAATHNQFIAYLVSWVILLVFFLLDKFLIILPGWLATVLQYISTSYHFSNIVRGVIDTRDIIYFLSLTAFFIYLSVRALQARQRV